VSRGRRRRRHPAGTSWSPPEEVTGYDGAATLAVGDRVIDVTVHLDGHLEPLDGRYHWYGRIERSDVLAAVKDGGATVGTLSIGDAEPAELRLAEYDPWGHVQVKGVGAPPYPMEPVEIELPAASR
jgi:hypothetical protein